MDTQTFTDMVHAHSHTIYKFCYSLAFSKEEAEDLFQETFLKAFENAQKGAKIKSPQGYLISTTLFIWKSLKRKHARRNRIANFQPLHDAIPHPSNTELDFISQEDATLVKEIVAKLPDKFKMPTLLYYSANATLAEIATALNIPQGTVKSRLHKARQLIEKRLIENGYK